jgi:hypothetical protein
MSSVLFKHSVLETGPKVVGLKTNSFEKAEMIRTFPSLHLVTESFQTALCQNKNIQDNIQNICHPYFRP